MAQTLAALDALARDPVFESRVRFALAYESEERILTRPYVGDEIMRAIVSDATKLQEYCYRAAWGLRNQADLLTVTDSAVRNAVSAVMDRVYPVTP